MQYNFVAMIFLLVIEANFLNGSQWNKLKRPKRGSKIFNGRPEWGSAVKSDYLHDGGRPQWGFAVQHIPVTTAKPQPVKRNGFAFDKTGHPIWSSQKYYALDKYGRPIWGIEENTPKTTTPPTTTTTKRSDYTAFDVSGRPIWGPVENTPFPWDKPPTTAEKSTTTTTIPNIITNNVAKLIRTQRDNATTSNKFPDEENPCEREPPPKKTSFSAPGKRMALQKCEEYKEEEKYNLQMRKNDAACMAYNIAHNITNVGVTNGLPTEQGEYPHMAALGWLTNKGPDVYDFQCGGILISSNFVLTAAHCTYNPKSSELADFTPKIVRLGDNNIGDEGNPHEHRITVPISVIIKHNQHKNPSKYNDIALLKLEKEVFFNADVRPACLWHQFDTTSLSTKANVTGWGKTSPMSEERSSKLLYGELNIVTNKICNESLDFMLSTRRLPNGVEDRIQICAGIPSGGVDTCQGDSGGPLQIVKKEEEVSVYYVIGVTSLGVGCAVPGIPGIYTRVSSYLDWIESCVWDDINSPTCLKYSKKML